LKAVSPRDLEVASIIHIHTYIHTYIYIYRERERGRAREGGGGRERVIHVYSYIYTHPRLLECRISERSRRSEHHLSPPVRDAPAAPAEDHLTFIKQN